MNAPLSVRHSSSLARCPDPTYEKLVDKTALGAMNSRNMIGMTYKYSNEMMHNKLARNRNMSKIFPDYGITSPKQSF